MIFRRGKMQQKKRLFGLKEKFLLMVLLPVVCTFVLVGLYSRNSLNAFGDKVNNDSTAIVKQLAEKEIMEKARSVAKQLELALLLSPGIASLKLNDNQMLRELAIQPVGTSGYTVLWQRPPAGSEVALTLIHPAKELVGKDTPPLVKKRMGDNYQAWYDVYSRAFTGEESQGYYPWADSAGQLRDKFMAIAPVKNSPYSVSATTYLDEFLTPVNTLQKDIAKHNRIIERVHLSTMAIGLVLIIAFVMFGIQKITRQIIRLTDAISEVSTGKTDTEIEIPKSNDELQDLAEAI